MRFIRGLTMTVVFCVLVSASLSQQTLATITSTNATCDGAAKYYCAYVTWDEHGSYVDFVSRFWKGGLGGSGCPTYCTTKDWQLWWLQDWYWNGSSWQWQRNFGSSPWYQNGLMSAWHNWSGYTLNQPALINFRFQYHDYYPDTGQNYYWCSPQLDHRLDIVSSYPVGGGTC
jgi:hypothetical protein